MSNTAVAYTGMPPTLWAPPAPQLIKNARMIIIGYQADPDALAAVLPPGLTPHPNNMIQMKHVHPAGRPVQWPR